jgi:membrane associated rhomboid family serine protease
MVTWKAVGCAIVASFVIGILSGLGLPFTDATLPTIGAGLSGLLAGAVAGYVNRGGIGSDAVHGLVGTTIGGLLVAVLLLLLGTIAAGVVDFGVGVAVLLVVVATGVPGAIGGALGGMVGGRRDTAGRPAA